MKHSGLSVEVRLEDGRHTVAVAGEMDLSNASTLEEAVRELCADGAREIVLDLQALTFMDSSGFRGLLVARSLCEKAECGFCLAPRVQPQVQRLLAIAGTIKPLLFARREQTPSIDAAGGLPDAEPGSR